MGGGPSAKGAWELELGMGGRVSIPKYTMMVWFNGVDLVEYGVLFILKTLNPANHPVIVSLLFVLAVTCGLEIATFSKSWSGMLGVLGFQFLQQSDGFGDGGGIVLGPGLGQAAAQI